MNDGKFSIDEIFYFLEKDYCPDPEIRAAASILVRTIIEKMPNNINRYNAIIYIGTAIRSVGPTDGGCEGEE